MDSMTCLSVCSNGKFTNHARDTLRCVPIYSTPPNLFEIALVLYFGTELNTPIEILT
jgi:hypothetical protein